MPLRAHSDPSKLLSKRYARGGKEYCCWRFFIVQAAVHHIVSAPDYWSSRCSDICVQGFYSSPTRWYGSWGVWGVSRNGSGLASIKTSWVSNQSRISGLYSTIYIHWVWLSTRSLKSTINEVHYMYICFLPDIPSILLTNDLRVDRSSDIVRRAIPSQVLSHAKSMAQAEGRTEYTRRSA